MKLTKTLMLIVSSLLLNIATPAFADTTLPSAPIVLSAPTAVPIETKTVVTTITITPTDIKTPLTPPVVSEHMSPSSVDCLVKAMNHEAGGEGTKGQKAVGYVIINRTKSGRFPSTVCGVVFQRSQFTNIGHAKAIPEKKYNTLKALALEIISSYSKITDPTRGSLFFHNTSIGTPWRHVVRMVQIGSQVFYK